MNFSLRLRDIPGPIKNLLRLYLIIQTLGFFLGLFLVGNISNYSAKGIQEHYRGSQVENAFEMPEKFPISLKALLITTHSHVISFAQIFLILSFLIFFCELPASIKKFLMYEPLVSIFTTFGGIWGLRYVHPAFLYVIIISSVLLYTSYFAAVFLILRESVLPTSKIGYNRP